MTGKSSVLVLGATGGIGGEVARQLREAGWDVRALQRRASNPAERRDGITWIRGDALNAHDVRAAADGCSVIVHAVNPPGYRRWSELVLPMLDNTIAAASAVGATIVLPGTIYNFGPDAFPVLTDESPQHHVTRKGAIRVEMERRLLVACKNGGRSRGNWLRRKVSYPQNAVQPLTQVALRAAVPRDKPYKLGDGDGL
jgi:nucleoside-diphosphate-sugar epimerase